MGANLLGDAPVNVPNPVRPAVNEPGIALEEAGTGGNPLPRLLRGGNAADGNEDKLRAHASVQPAEYF